MFISILPIVMNFNLIKIRLKIMFYSIFGKIGDNFSKIRFPSQDNIKKVIIFFPLDEDSFRVSLYSFRKFNFYNTNVSYYFIINHEFRNLINLTGPNLVYVNYNRNKIKWCDMNDKHNIINQSSIDMVIDLNQELCFDLAKFINQLNSNIKIGFKSIYSDYFYNIQIDIGENGIVENGFNKIQQILRS